ncbi:unnamed protein product [Withania somnifera]
MERSNFLSSSMKKVNFRTKVLSRHLNQETPTHNFILQSLPCLSYSPPELSEPSAIFDIKEMRKLTDGHNLVEKDWLLITVRRIEYLHERGVFKKWLTGKGPEDELRILAFTDCVGIFDHSLAIKVGVHFYLWYVFV